jgi:hypothetical protein
MRAFFVPLAIAVLVGSSVGAKQSKCDATLHQIDKLLDVYGKEHPLKHYPSTLKEFQNFAAARRVTIDLSAFSQFEYKRHGMSLDIVYTCKDTGESGVAGHSVIIAY